MSEIVIRAQLIKGLLAAGATPHDAATITDVAIHAAHSAIGALDRVCNSLTGTDPISAGLIALQLLEASLPHNIAAHEAKIRALPGCRTAYASMDTRQ